MPKKNFIKTITRRNQKYRKMIEEASLERNSMMQIYRFPELPRNIRELAFKDLKKMSNKTSIICAKKMCTILTRSRGLVNQFRVGRMVYRHYGDRGQIAGLQRAKF